MKQGLIGFLACPNCDGEIYTVSKLPRPLSKLPSGSSVVNWLFYGQYLTYISPFCWREQHTIVFDHLVARDWRRRDHHRLAQQAQLAGLCEIGR